MDITYKCQKLLCTWALIPQRQITHMWAYFTSCRAPRDLHLRTVIRSKAEKSAFFRSCWLLDGNCDTCLLIDSSVSHRRKSLSCTECYRPSSRRPICSPSSRKLPISSNRSSMSVHFWQSLICHTRSGSSSYYARESGLGISICEYSGCFSYPIT